MHSVDYAVARCLSVRPSVCLSVTRRYSDETAKHILETFFTRGQPHHSSCQYQTGWQYSDEYPPPLNGGVEYKKV